MERPVLPERIEDFTREDAHKLAAYSEWVRSQLKEMGSGDFSIGSSVWPGLSKLIEECGEVLQASGKLIGSRGERKHWDGSDLVDKMNEELGDILAAVWFFIDKNAHVLDHKKIHNRAQEKHKRFCLWHEREQDGINRQRCVVCGHLLTESQRCKHCEKVDAG